MLEQFNAPQDILSRATSVNIHAACGWVGPVLTEKFALRCVYWMSRGLGVMYSAKCVQIVTKCWLCSMSCVLGGSWVACCLHCSAASCTECSTDAVCVQY